MNSNINTVSARPSVCLSSTITKLHVLCASRQSDKKVYRQIGNVVLQVKKKRKPPTSDYMSALAWPMTEFCSCFQIRYKLIKYLLKIKFVHVCSFQFTCTEFIRSTQPWRSEQQVSFLHQTLQLCYQKQQIPICIFEVFTN